MAGCSQVLAGVVETQFAGGSHRAVPPVSPQQSSQLSKIIDGVTAMSVSGVPAYSLTAYGPNIQSRWKVC
jgi:hypothetical protein